MKNYPKRLHLCRIMLAETAIHIDDLKEGGKQCPEYFKGFCCSDYKPCNDIVYERVKRG